MTHGLSQLEIVGRIAALPPRERAKGVEIVGPWGSGKALVAVQTAEALGAPLLYVSHGRIEAEAAHEDLATFAGPDRAVLLPAWEVLPTDAMKPADDVISERMDALSRLARARESKTPVYASVSVRSFLQRVVSPERLTRDTVRLRVGKEYDLEAIVARLVEMGYEREWMVEQRGQLSVRGGIFDVFPISAELPFRIEFFGDEVESIRRFEPETQRSVDSLDGVEILPRSEQDLLRELAAVRTDLCAVSDYFGENTLLVIDEPMAVDDEARRLDEQFPATPFLMTWTEALARAKTFPRLALCQVSPSANDGVARFIAPMHTMSGWAHRAEGFWDQLKEWDAEGYTVQLYCNNTGERRRLFELLEERGYRPGQDGFDLRVALGAIREGFASPADKLAVLSEREMFGRRYVKRTRRRYTAGASITAFSDLRAGDYVVHVQHGVGRYSGLKRFPGKAADFLAIQYSGGDMLYVPVTHVDLVQKFVGGEGAVPKIDRLGGSSWSQTRRKVKEGIRDMTAELLSLYAKRQGKTGHAFGSDTHWQREFEDSFEYEETPDQLRAIVEVKEDMESPKPMDRLLCGDVGFGKTEVALRAAFKAVMDGKQVAVLAPTTVLAEQHFQTFQERFADYPIRVELLSRFRTAKQQKETIDRMKSGEADVVIGTHRLISRDVGFKDLGLVVLDEEQRFGVAQKERLKQLKPNVDVLTLSATPIPRTMHMALMGVRDMSIINTAPNDRLPIHTHIDVYDEGLIREAILRELGREGQVFYLHNRVQTIERAAAQVKKLVPRARVAVAHGQMAEHGLEEVMRSFIRKEIDVLVCTTIIGSGLDIPNANTIIVDRADQFGLSELYQLRGRVGRYKHRAFAYLLAPGDRALSEEAQRRLKALEEFSTLGAGFRIAMRDLEIRGAGNLLGPEQSGYIATVGFETYTQLIEETVAEMKGEAPSARYLPPFDVATDGHIPDAYVRDESHKITLYKRISSIRSVGGVEEMAEELRDRFGPVPRPVQRLLNVMRVRALGAEAGVARISAGKDGVTLEFDRPDFLAGAVKGRLRERFGARLQFLFAKVPGVRLALGEGDDPVDSARGLLEALIGG